jgi:hypothetical protein
LIRCLISLFLLVLFLSILKTEAFLGFLLPFVAAVKDGHNRVLEILKLGEAEDFVGIIIRVVVAAVSTDILFNVAFSLQFIQPLSFYGFFFL